PFSPHRISPSSKQLSRLWLHRQYEECVRNSLVGHGFIPFRNPVWGLRCCPSFDAGAGSDSLASSAVQGGVSMKLFGRFINACFFIFLLIATTAAAWAADPPSRVARLQYMSGSVSIQPHGTEDWVAGSINRPLTSTDNIWTDKD